MGMRINGRQASNEVCIFAWGGVYMGMVGRVYGDGGECIWGWGDGGECI